MTTFSKDTGMTFGEGKCAYQQVENGKLIKNTEDLKINNLNIKPIKENLSIRTFIFQQSYCP